MPTGDWCKGQTKDSSERVANMAKNVSKALLDPDLRIRLDEQKKIPIYELYERIEGAESRWELLSNLETDYTRLSDKNLQAMCPKSHEVTLSVKNIIDNVKCKICEPKRVGTLNPAFKPVEKFLEELLEKFGEDRFLFDISAYSGMRTKLEFQCAICHTKFSKMPSSLIGQDHGCPACARKASTDRQSRSEQHFLFLVQQKHPNRYVFHPTEDQRYNNASSISRTCTVCNDTRKQPIWSMLNGNGCVTCSQRVKHTTESFIALAKRIWGEGEFDYSQVQYVNNKHPVILTCKKGHTFSCAPSNHFGKKGCPDCAIKKFVSAGETEWLDSLMIPAENRNKWLKIGDQKVNVDALINETIYEYYGDFWHGNTKRFAPDFVNVYSGMTMQEHLDYTVSREQILREAGYVVITMWEQDWMKLRKTRPISKKAPSDSAA